MTYKSRLFLCLGLAIGLIAFSSSVSLATDDEERVSQTATLYPETREEDQRDFENPLNDADDSSTNSGESNVVTDTAQSAPAPSQEPQQAQDSAQDNVQISNEFPLPSEIRARVDFWKDVYSKYTTRQAILHDSENLGIVYDVVELHARYGTRAAQQDINAHRNRIVDALKRLYDNNGVASTAEEQAIAAKFSHIPGRNKYIEAAERIRVQLGIADRFKEGLQRSNRYLNYMKTVFKSYNLPEGLTALPHVESSFNYNAYSFVGAAGIWQFMRSTGRMFMRVDYTVDERRDPIISTDGAARLMRLNYLEVKSWPLAITSYNHGAYGMKKAKAIYGDDIAAIIKNYKGKAFGFASKNFYTEFLAALEVSKNYKTYFGDVQFEPEFKFDEIAAPRNLSGPAMAKKLGVSVATLQDHNPALRSVIWSGKRVIPAGYRLKVPAGRGEPSTVLANASTPKPEIALLASASKKQKNDEQQQTVSSQKAVETHVAKVENHVVKKNETIAAIANKYNISVDSIKVANNLKSYKLRKGQKIKIPTTVDEAEPVKSTPSAAPVEVASNSEQAVADDAQSTENADFYYVRAGDTLSVIAKKYGITVAKLTKINGLSKKSKLHIGQKLALDSNSAEAEDNSSNGDFPQLASVAPVTDAPVHTKSSDDSAAGKSAKKSADTSTASSQTYDGGESFNIGGRVIRIDAANYAVRITGSNQGEITIRQDETIGHYAEWLGVNKTTLQRTNRTGKKSGLQIGQKLRIPLNKVRKEQFERARLEYHTSQLEDFLEAYRVDGEKTVQITSGQSIWDMCDSESEAPMWLVRLYNPGIRFDSLKPGDSVKMPVVVKK